MQNFICSSVWIHVRICKKKTRNVKAFHKHTGTFLSESLTEKYFFVSVFVVSRCKTLMQQSCTYVNLSMQYTTNINMYTFVYILHTYLSHRNIRKYYCANIRWVITLQTRLFSLRVDHTTRCISQLYMSKNAIKNWTKQDPSRFYSFWNFILFYIFCM